MHRALADSDYLWESSKFVLRAGMDQERVRERGNDIGANQEDSPNDIVSTMGTSSVISEHGVCVVLRQVNDFVDA